MNLWPFRHAGLKLLSLGLAILLWMVIAGDQTVERGLRVPLELQQFPPELELLGEPPTAVDVRLRGASDTLTRLGPGEVVAVLDLGTARPGRRLFQLTPEHVRAPFGVEVVQVTPASVAIVFESSATVRLPIMPSIEGEPAPGYVVGEVTVDPPVVEVSGPASLVRDATQALTETVSIAGAADHVVEDAAVGVDSPSLRIKGPRTTAVRVEILPGPRERVFPARPVHLRRLAANLTARALPSVVDVAVRGSGEAVRALDRDAVVAFVDLGNLGAGEYRLTVQTDVLEEAGVVRIVPPAVQVRITSVPD
jgi:YbbR domain-containing protein